MKNSYFLSVFILSCAGQLFGAACSTDSNFPRILAVGGQNTLGSEVDYVARLFDVREDCITRSPLPQGWIKDGIDLGQDVCMQNLASVFPAHGDVVFHATSQGTATTLNFVATLPAADQQRIKLIVLEAVLASGNSAIMHNAKPILGPSTETSGCDYSVPYSATSLFPRYSPSGKQAIKSIEDITHDIPIVIVHAKEDACLPYSGACAAYYGLRSQGHENVYFIPCEGSDHIRILEYKPCQRVFLRSILAKHKLFGRSGFTPMSPLERQMVQPEIEQFREAYEQLRSHERNHSIIPWAIGGVALLGALKIAKPRVAQFCASRGIDSLQALLNWIKPS